MRCLHPSHWGVNAYRRRGVARRSAGYSRWLWNWGLDLKQKAYAEGIKLNKSQLRKFYTNVDFLPTEKQVDKVGVDLGISNLATLSTEVLFENPKAYAKALKRLARLQRDLSRKVFQSHNWYKTKLKVRLAHRKVADIRSNAIHHLTSYLAKNHGAVVMQDLNVKGLLFNRHLSKALSDAALGMIRTQTEYKCQRYGAELILADRFFPSSQLCSNCGHRQKMPLSVRVYSCPECSMKKDRDLNASLNLQSIVAGSVTLRSMDGGGRDF